MTFDEYQTLAARTSGAGDGDERLRLAIAGLGLTGEAGEVTEDIKKHVGHGHPLDGEALTKELGDVLWYIAEICSRCGLSMEAVAQGNINKLRQRYPDGFTEADSRNRSV